MDSPVAGSRIRLHRDALVRLLADQPVPPAFEHGLTERGLLCVSGGEEEPAEEDLALWQERGWGLSLASYLWSRSVSYYDSGPGEEDRRSAAIESMLHERSCPLPPEPDPSAVSLQAVGDWDAPPLSAVLAKRRSVGAFRQSSVDRGALAALLYYGTSKIRACRRAASAEKPSSLLISVGAAFDIYVLVYAVDGLISGVHRYHPETNTLSLVKAGNFREAAYVALAGQPAPKNAAATILLVADFARYQWRYRHERALRNLYLEAGRLMQPLILVATALGLQTGITPAVRDEEIADLLGENSENWQALHTLTVA
ncbi:SagB/ThcOx family dehydrogenase [Frankia sp. AiPs1]|uniref:SagB/ThcOx family dehydrogenase n=1 Tax=Frankia sp. AiPs1 TaxID=573493 RepID=UPI002043BE4E|nr:SagB/ThcOx family dehydrogenase [Frankia sp. AiPs1]MCM3920655.1 SagB/ThcOx family dehydrogenase [Frankia sp. AiPs1]